MRVYARGRARAMRTGKIMRHARASTPLRTLIQNRSLTRLHRRLLCSADLHPASRAAAAAASSSASAHTGTC